MVRSLRTLIRLTKIVRRCANQALISSASPRFLNDHFLFFLYLAAFSLGTKLGSLGFRTFFRRT